MIPDIFTSILIICQTGISLDCFDVDVSALDIVCETEPSIFPQDCDNPLQESGNFLAPTGALEEGILCVRVSVRVCVILFKITVKMSSSSILKSPEGF